MRSLTSFINWSEVARECFNRHKSRFYQKLNGNKVNGKPAEFTREEKLVIAKYLRRKAAQIIQVADYIEK